MISGLPPFPQFDEDLMSQCRQTRDPVPLLFEWFKLVGILSINIGSIAPDTAGYLVRPRSWRAVTTGLACRCGRLIYAIAKLSYDGQCSESAAILSRSIAESAVVLKWLTCSENPVDAFTRYLADGLKTDLQLEDRIHAAIAERDGNVLLIEKRMLDSIERSRSDAGMNRSEVEAAKKLLDVRSMMGKLDLDEGHYFGVHRMMSQFVHGTWTDLRAHYIRNDDEHGIAMKDIDEARIHPNNLLLVIVVVADALRSLFGFYVSNEQLRDEFNSYLDEVMEGVALADSFRSDGDFHVVD